MNSSRDYSVKSKGCNGDFQARMAAVKEERPTSSSTGASQDTNTNNEVTNLTSLTTLNLLHQQVPTALNASLTDS